MFISLSPLFEEKTKVINIDDEIRDKNVSISGRNIHFNFIKFNGTAYSAGKDKYISINIEYDYIEECSICLEQFSAKNETSLNAKLVIGDEKDFTFKEDTDYEEVIFYDGEELYLEDDILDTIILDMPMIPKCKESCLGLCSKCGVNKNIEACDCKSETIDPRFEKLKDFFDK